MGCWAVANKPERSVFRAGGRWWNPKPSLWINLFTSRVLLQPWHFSLSGRSIEEFDNILEGICVTSKGKWLDLLETCLGVGAVVVGENTRDNDGGRRIPIFTDLDLSKADITESTFWWRKIFSGLSFERYSVIRSRSDKYKLHWRCVGWCHCRFFPCPIQRLTLPMLPLLIWICRIGIFSSANPGRLIGGKLNGLSIA